MYIFLEQDDILRHGQWAPDQLLQVRLVKKNHKRNDHLGAVCLDFKSLWVWLATGGPSVCSLWPMRKVLDIWASK